MLKFINVFALALRYAVPWLCLCVALYLFAGIMAAAFQSESGANIWIQLMSNVSRTRAFAFVFGFLGVLYGIQERNLRRTTVKRLRARLNTLEQALTQKSNASQL
jgi:hypothetical protein